MNFSTVQQKFYGIVNINDIKISDKLIDYINGNNNLYIENPYFIKPLAFNPKNSVKTPFKDYVFKNESGEIISPPRVFYKHVDGKFYNFYKIAWTNVEKHKRFYIQPPFEHNKDNDSKDKIVLTKRCYISTSVKDNVLYDEDKLLNKISIDLGEVLTILFICCVYDIKLNTDRYKDCSNVELYNNIVEDISEIYTRNNISIREMEDFDEEQFNASDFIYEEVMNGKNKVNILHYKTTDGDYSIFNRMIDRYIKFYTDNNTKTQNKKVVENKEFVYPSFITDARKKTLLKYLSLINNINIPSCSKFYTPNNDNSDDVIEDKLSFQIKSNIQLIQNDKDGKYENLATTFIESTGTKMERKKFTSPETFEYFYNNYSKVSVDGIIYLKPEIKISSFVGECFASIYMKVDTFDVEKRVIEEKEDVIMTLANDRRKVISNEEINEFNEISDE